MAERITQPTEAADTNWNSDGTTYPSTDPGSSKRATGFKPKDVPTPGDGEIITANDQNWLHGLAMQMHTYFRQYQVREWEELSEAIAAAELNDLIRVCPAQPAGYIPGRMGLDYTASTTATGGGDINQLCVDGQQLYYFAGTTNAYIVIASPVDGTEVSEVSVGYEVTALDCDGRYIYYSSNSGSHVGLRRYDTDGTSPSNGGTSYGHNLLRANGTWVAGIAPSSLGAGYVEIWIADPISLVVSTNTGSAALRGVGIDSSQCYVGGDRNTNDVWAYVLSSGASAWSVTLDTNAPTIYAIAADGDCVYVATDDLGLAAGGNACLFCLQRTDGTLLWTMDLGVDLRKAAVDGEHLYVVDKNDNLYQIHMHGPAPAVVATKTSVDSDEEICVDGVSLFARLAGTITDFRRYTTGGPTKTFMVAKSDDPNRRPFYTLAVPIDGRV